MVYERAPISDEDVDLDELARVNDEIQEWVSTFGADLHPELLKLLSDLDHVAPTWREESGEER